MASSIFVRHTLNALYSDLIVVPRKFVVLAPGTSPPSGSAPGSSTPAIERSKKGKSREKSLFVGLNVTGTARVSGGPGEWEV